MSAVLEPKATGSANVADVVTQDLSLTTVQDWAFASGTEGYQDYGWSYTLSLVRNPTGNHVNQLREPGMVSVVHAVKLDRKTFTGDSDPTMVYYLDNLTQAGGTTSPGPTEPPRREQSTGYATLWYMIDTKAERIQITFSRPAENFRAEHQMIAFIWNPDFGV